MVNKDVSRGFAGWDNMNHESIIIYQAGFVVLLAIGIFLISFI